MSNYDGTLGAFRGAVAGIYPNTEDISGSAVPEGYGVANLGDTTTTAGANFTIDNITALSTLPSWATIVSGELNISENGTYILQGEYQLTGHDNTVSWVIAGTQYDTEDVPSGMVNSSAAHAGSTMSSVGVTSLIQVLTAPTIFRFEMDCTPDSAPGGGYGTVVFSMRVIKIA